MVDATFAFIFKQKELRQNSSSKDRVVFEYLQVKDDIKIEVICEIHNYFGHMIHELRLTSLKEQIPHVTEHGKGEQINRKLSISFIRSPLFKEDSSITVNIENIHKYADSYMIGSLKISINETSYSLNIPEKAKEGHPGYLSLTFSPPAVSATGGAATGGAATGGAATAPPEQFEPTYLKNKYGDCVIQCPECKLISGKDLSRIFSHTLSCSNKNKVANLTERESKCASAPQMGGRRRTRRRHSRHRQSRRRRRRRQPTKLTALSRRAATPVR
jgi:hypothetical protein